LKTRLLLCHSISYWNTPFRDLTSLNLEWASSRGGQR
jgi:hypothetical protein